MVAIVDRARMSTSTVGTGSLTLTTAAVPYQTFSAAGMVTGDTPDYLIEDGNAWEIGVGLYNSSTLTMTRSLVKSSTGSLLSLSGSALVSVIVSAATLRNFLFPLQFAPVVIGTGGTNTLIGSLLQATGTNTVEVQIEAQNLSNGTLASTDLVVTANDGTETVNYADFGINSSTNADPAWTVAGAHDAYLYSSSSNLTIGTGAANKWVTMFVGGTMFANAIGSFTPTGYSGLIAGVAADAAIDLNLMAGPLDSRLTFTRAGTATYFDANGVMQIAGANVPRFDHDPVSLASLGVLREESRTNILLQNAGVTASPWTTVSGVAAAPTLTANNSAAPDGTTTATRIVAPAVTAGSGGYSLVQQSFTTTAQQYTGSIWLKGNAGGEQVWIAFNGPGNFVTLATLTTAWQRFFVTATLIAGTSSFQIGTDLRTLSGETATAAQTYFAWGGQVEAGPFQTSTIPTTSSAVTRNGEALSMPVSVGATAFGLAVDCLTGTGVPAVYGTPVRLSNGTDTAGFLSTPTSNPPVRMYSSVGSGGSSGVAYSAAKFAFSGALSVAGTTLVAVGNGQALGGGATGTMATFTTLTIGDGFGTWNGWVSRVRVWNRSLTLSEQMAMTAYPATLSNAQIDQSPIGLKYPAPAAFTSVSVSGLLTVKGTINASGIDASPIGATTPAAGSFTTLAATGLISPAPAPGIKGSLGLENANSGSVGEYMSSTVLVASAVALTNGTPANVTSLTLTAGDWDVSGAVVFVFGGSTTVTNLGGGVSNVSATVPGDASGQISRLVSASFVPVNDIILPVAPSRFLVNATTTVYLIAHASFGVSTCAGAGTLRARRMR